jgi:hypothetical protein
MRFLTPVFACLLIGGAHAQGDPLAIFNGIWVSVKPPGPQVIFDKVGLNTREASLPNFGQASIRVSNGENGSNFLVSGEGFSSGSGFSCFYLILTTNQRTQMVWELKSGPSVCFASAVFERVNDPVSPTSPPQSPTPSPSIVPSPPQSLQPPRVAVPNFLEAAAQDRWCVSGRVYSLRVADNTIVWTDDRGFIDRETVIEISRSGVRSVTRQSIHPGYSGQPIGKGWSYSSGGQDTINVTPSEGRPFMLRRC